MENIDVRTCLTFLVELKDISLLVEDGNEDNLRMLFFWVAKYAMNCYGRKLTKQMIQNGKGMLKLLECVTSSDIAYSMAVVEDNIDYWDSVFDLKKEGTGRDELRKYKKKHQMEMSEEEKEKYTLPARKFTGTKIGKNKFGEDGWSGEGKNFYSTQWKKWRSILGQRSNWEKIMVVWENFEEENSALSMQKMTGQNKELDNGCDEGDFVAFHLPGDEEHEDDRPWEKNHSSGNQDETNSRSSEAGNMGHRDMIQSLINLPAQDGDIMGRQFGGSVRRESNDESRCLLHHL